MPENKHKSFNKKIAGLIIFIFFSLSFSPISAKKAEAFIFVDWVNFAVNAVSSLGDYAIWIKEYALDAVAYQVVDLIIQRMTASTVNWINSGFKGSPAYVTDPASYFKDVGDKVAGDFIFNNPNLNFLCQPISLRIKIALSENYSGYSESWQCTLTDVYGNMDDFINDFERGGWDKFFRLTQEQQNNPIGAYIQAEGTLADMIAEKTNSRQQELSWGKGFMSFKQCPSGRKVKTVIKNVSDGSSLVTYEDGVTITQKTPVEIGDCGVEEKTVTPGSVIEGQLGEVLSIGGKKLAVADEINEIVSALLNQVVNRIIGGIGSGLRGLSGNDPSQQNQVFTNQLYSTTTDQVIQEYFNNSQTDVQNTLNQPPYDPYGTSDPYGCVNNPNQIECSPAQPVDTTTFDPNQTP